MTKVKITFGKAGHISISADGKNYAETHQRLKYFSSIYDIGDQIIVYIDPETGSAEHLHYIFAFVYGGVGLCFLPLGIVFLTLRCKKINHKKRLMQKGKIIYARIVDLKENRRINYNNRYPYKLICECYQEFYDQDYTFVSDNIFIDDEVDYLGKYVAVYVMDPKTCDKYYVDASDLRNEIDELY